MIQNINLMPAGWQQTVHRFAPSGLERRTDQARAQVLSVIRARMPIRSLFNPELKIDLGIFIKDQMLLQRIALLLSTQRAATAEGVAPLFAESGLLAEIPDLPLFYQACVDALCYSDGPSRLEDAIQRGIYTLKQALKNKETSLIRESIRIHLAGPCEGSFQQELTATAEQLLPFVEGVTKRYLQERNIEAVDPVLQQRSLKGLNFHALVAATAMECGLHVLGFDVELLERKDLDPRVSPTPVHSVVVATGPDGSRYVIDPCYLQFHKEVLFADAELPIAPVLVLKESEVDPYVEKHLLGPWKAVHALFLTQDPIVMSKLEQNNQAVSHRFASLSCFESRYRMLPEEWVKTTFVRAWEAHSYTRPLWYRLYNEIFTDNGGLKTHEYVKPLGLASLMGRASLFEVGRQIGAIQRDYRRLRKNDVEALKLFSQFYTDRATYYNIFDIDPRNQNLGLALEVNAYYRSLRKTVNPERADISVIYGCPGSDCTSVLLATEATELFFVDAAPVSFDLLLEMLENLKKPEPAPYIQEKIFAEDYISLRRVICGGRSQLLPGRKYSMSDREFKLIFDLKMMAVDLTQIKISSFEEGVKIEFPWGPFESNRAKDRTLYLLTADITEPDRYPAILKERIRNGFDIVYMKASYHAPLDYPKFLPILAKGVKAGGWLMTSDRTHDMRYIEPQESLRGQGLTFIERGSEENEVLREILSHAQDPHSAMELTLKTAYDRSTRMTNASPLYWSIVNLRQKQ